MIKSQDICDCVKTLLESGKAAHLQQAIEVTACRFGIACRDVNHCLDQQPRAQRPYPAPKVRRPMQVEATRGNTSCIS